MPLPVHEITLRDVENNSGEYQVALRDAVSLLVEEQKNFVPIYMPGGVVNALEAAVLDAQRKGTVEEIDARLKTDQVINTFRSNLNKIARYMGDEWGDDYGKCIFLSNDVYSSNPAITKPEDSIFNFELRPKTFDLGLTGRLLEDEKGTRFQERLKIKCDIYDAYNLAVDLCPARIIAVDSKGNQTVVYEDHKEVGEKEIVQKEERGETIRYVFNEDQKYHWNCDTEVLPTDGLKVVFSDFYEKIKKYNRAMIFGHKYSDMKEFLGMARVLDQHLIWDICAYFIQGGDPNTPLHDCEREYGLKNKAAELPYHKNRLQLIPGNAHLYFGQFSLHFDHATAIQSLMSLDDIVTDIWMEPVDRRWDSGWDIVYDRRRHITPGKPVAVTCIADYERYSVLKGSKDRYREILDNNSF